MTCEIVLVRHAIAYERDARRWPDDSRRPLTPEGRRRFRRAARGLAKWIPKVDRVFTSPLVRARQTAELLSDCARWPEATVMPELAPPGNPSRLIAGVRDAKSSRVALIGHEPALSTLLSACIAGSVSDLRVVLKKGGIVLIEFPDEVRAGSGVLLALLPPRALRRMG